SAARQGRRGPISGVSVSRDSPAAAARGPRLRLGFRPARSSSPDGKMLEARAANDIGLVKIASVEYHRLAQMPTQRLEIGAAEFLPFGADDERSGILAGRHRIGCERQPVEVAQKPLALLDRDGIVR